MDDPKHQRFMQSSFFRASSMQVLNPLALAMMRDAETTSAIGDTLASAASVADDIDEPDDDADNNDNSDNNNDNDDNDDDEVRPLPQLSNAVQSPLTRSRAHSSVHDFKSIGAQRSIDFGVDRAQEQKADEMLSNIRKHKSFKAVVSTIMLAQRLMHSVADQPPPLTRLGDASTAAAAAPPAAASGEDGAHTLEFDRVNGKAIVTAGTLEALVELLVGESEIGLDYTHNFLSTYRYFTESKNLMQLLIKFFAEAPGITEVGSPAGSDTDEGTSNSGSALSSTQSSRNSSKQSIGKSIESLTINTSLSLKQPVAAPKNHGLFQRSRVLNVLRMWVTRHPEDFVCNDTLEHQLVDFLEQDVLVMPALSRYGDSIKECIRANHIAASDANPRHPLSTAFLHSYAIETNEAGISLVAATLLDNRSKATASVLDFKAEKMAQQLTLLEMEFFRKVYQDELVMQKWTKAKRDNAAVNLLRDIAWFNHVSYWVATEICLEAKPAQRAALIKFFLDVARYCLSYHNFSTVFEIVSGLVLSPVSRLKKTWKALPAKSKQLWADLTKFTAPENNFAPYRDTLRNSGYPLVPYIGVHLKDLTFAEDGSPTMLARNRVNFYKCYTVGTILNDVRQYQQAQYNFKEDPKILSWLQHSMVNMSMTDLTKISKRFEPPEEV